MKRLILLIVPMIILWNCKEKKTSTGETTIKQELSTKQKDFFDCYNYKFLDSLHTRKTVNRKDKSFKEFILKNSQDEDTTKKVIYIQPFGYINPRIKKIVEQELLYLEIFFQDSFAILPVISFDEILATEKIKTRTINETTYGKFSKNKGQITNLREQIEANSFIDNCLITNKLKNSKGIIGITEQDIYNPKYNYLFGTSRLKEKIGLVSVFRIIDYGVTTKHNIRKVLSKQITNLMNIRNVKDYNCLMNFHNNKVELENGKFQLSPIALSKLSYKLNFDSKKRAEELMVFWKQENNNWMALYYEKILEALKKQLPAKPHS